MEVVIKWQDILDPWGLKRLKKLLQLKGNIKLPITILTGPELSKESGIATFRGENGIWIGHRLEDVAYKNSLQSNPSLALRFYNQRRSELLDGRMSPTEGHLALTKLANVLGEVFIITQNPDNLHEVAGSVAIHLYGSFLWNRCTSCGHSWESTTPLLRETKCVQCEAKAVRPDVVFLKEAPKRMASALECLAQGKVFLSLGNPDPELVLPLLEKARQNGDLCIEINPKATELSERFDLSIRKPLSQAIPLVVDFLIYQP
jgi:NAD-dependent deacetylase